MKIQMVETILLIKNNDLHIGEIGQNHNGSVKIAKKIIDSATSSVVEQLFNINLPIIMRLN